MHRLLTGVAVLLSCAVWAAETVSVTEILPGGGAAALYVRDLAGWRKDVAESDFGRLFADAEVQAFVGPIIAEFEAQYGKLRAADQPPVLPGLKELDKLCGGELALTVGQAEQGGAPCFAWRVPDKEALTGVLSPLLAGLPLEEGQPVSLGRRGPAVVFEKGLLLLAFNPDDLVKMRGRLADPAKQGDSLAKDADFLAARGLLGPGHATLVLSVPKALALLPEQNVAESIRMALSAFGGESAAAVALQLGRRGPVLTLDAALSQPGGAPPGATLPAEMLKVVPASTPNCHAMHFELSNLVSSLHKLAARDPVSAKELEKFLNKAKAELKVDLEKDLVQKLGDWWLAYDVASQGFFGLGSRSVLINTLKDEAGFRQALDTALPEVRRMLVAAAAKDQEGFLETIQVRETEMGGTKVWYLRLPMVMFTPCVAIREGRLYTAFHLSAMRAALTAPPGPDVTTAPAFKEALERAGGAPLDLKAIPAFSFTNPDKTKSVAGPIPDLLKMVNDSARVKMREELRFGRTPPPVQALLNVLDGLRFETFPSEEALRKYLRPSASVAVHLPRGTVWRCDLATPSWGESSNGLFAFQFAPMAGLLLPVLARAREQARRTQSLSNLGQMIRAGFMFGDVEGNNGRFPTDPYALVPDYIADPRLFQNPRFPEQDEAYVLVTGSTTNDAQHVVFYENLPEGDTGPRGVSFGDGHAESATPERFQECLAATEKALKERGVKTERVPISFQRMRQKQRRAVPAPPPAPGRGMSTAVEPLREDF